MTSQHYTKDFYERLRSGAARSAEVIIPIVLELAPARSVVDVGCGDGSWLAVFRKLGVEDVVGVDGDHVEQEWLQIPRDRFRPADLAKPFNVGRTFDLAVSLEVAEHLPPDCSSGFVDSLTKAAPIVLFSAAIPHQGGENHINEQWPEKWVGHFREQGYLAVDPIRRHVWQRDNVEFWYAQNTLLFARPDLVESNAALKAEFERTDQRQLSLVHPRQYLDLHSRYLEAARSAAPSGVIAASRLLGTRLKNAARKRLLGKA